MTHHRELTHMNRVIGMGFIGLVLGLAVALMAQLTVGGTTPPSATAAPGALVFAPTQN